VTHPNKSLARQEAVAAARAKYEGQAFAYGAADCARLAAFVLARRGLKPGLSRFGAYSSLEMARRKLAEQGFDSLPAWLDSIAGLKRAPFAFAGLGDIIAMPSGIEWAPALGVNLGGDKFLGFAEDGACCVMARNVLPDICWVLA
jgi:hypothetical protein